MRRRRLDSNVRWRGFTLLELLVVIAIMSMLLAGIGLYRLNQNRSGRIDAAVRMLSGMASRARMQAQVSGNPTRLLIDFEADSRGYLRSLSICEAQNGSWIVIGRSKELPRGIGVVPHEQRFLEGNWANHHSVFSDGGTPMYFDPDGRGSRRFLYVQFSPGGDVDFLSESDYLQPDITVNAALPQVMVAAWNHRNGGEIVYDNPNLRASIFLSMKGDVSIAPQP